MVLLLANELIELEKRNKRLRLICAEGVMGIVLIINLINAFPGGGGGNPHTPCTTGVHQLRIEVDGLKTGHTPVTDSESTGFKFTVDCVRLNTGDYFRPNLQGGSPSN